MDYIKETINFYNQNVDEYIKKTSDLQDKDWLEKFISYIPKHGSILDIGCAFGRDTNFFVSKNYDSTGIDLSEKMIIKAKEFVANAKFFVMNMLNLDFDENSFDGVWCSAALLHLNKEDSLKALKEIKRVLRPAGVLYLNLKEGSGEKFIIDDRYKNAKKFYSYYNEVEIKDILHENGFELQNFVLEKKPGQNYKNTGIIYLIARNIGF